MAKMQANDKFQGLCLTSSQGRLWMKHYDNMPPEAREAVRNSKYNICAACLFQRAYRMAYVTPDATHYIIALHEMENMIKCQEVQ